MASRTPVAEHRVHLFRFIQPHGEPVGEQVPDRQHVLAGVLQRSNDGVADCPPLGGEGGSGVHDPLAQLAVVLAGGQERDLIDQDRTSQGAKGCH